MEADENEGGKKLLDLEKRTNFEVARNKVPEA